MRNTLLNHWCDTITVEVWTKIVCRAEATKQQHRWTTNHLTTLVIGSLQIPEEPSHEEKRRKVGEVFARTDRVERV